MQTDLLHRFFGFKFRNRILFDVEVKLECETASFSRFAGDTNTAALQLNQSFYNAQAESGAAVFPGSFVGRLLIAFKYFFKTVLRDTDTGIVHFEQDRYFFFGSVARTYDEGDVSILGEFDGIADEVVQDLCQTGRISVNRIGLRGIYFQKQTQILFLCFVSE